MTSDSAKLPALIADADCAFGQALLKASVQAGIEAAYAPAKPGSGGLGLEWSRGGALSARALALSAAAAFGRPFSAAIACKAPPRDAGLPEPASIDGALADLGACMHLARELAARFRKAGAGRLVIAIEEADPRDEGWRGAALKAFADEFLGMEGLEAYAISLSEASAAAAADMGLRILSGLEPKLAGRWQRFGQRMGLFNRR
jgi:hypothetical protein